MAFGCPDELECKVVAGEAVCSCPPGCSGTDDWFYWEDSCHVNIKLRSTLHLIAFVMSLLVVATASVSLFTLSKRKYGVWWRLRRFAKKFLPHPPHAEQPVVVAEPANHDTSSPGNLHHDAAEPDAAFNDSQFESEYEFELHDPLGQSALNGAEGMQSRVQRHQIQLQALLSFWLVLNFLAFGVFFTVYEAISGITDVYRFEEGAAARLLDFCAGAGSASCLLGIWAVAFKWYDLMPSIKRYGRLLEVNSLLVRFPDFFYWWVRVWGAFSAISMLTLFFILPMANPAKRRSYDNAALATMAIIVAIWWMSMVTITMLLSHVFTNASRAFSGTVGAAPGARGASPARPKAHTETTLGSASLGHEEEPGAGEIASNPERSTDNSLLPAHFRTTVRSILIYTTNGSLCAFVVLLTTALWPPLNRNMYIGISVTAIIGHLSAITLMYLVILRATRAAK